MLYYLSIQHTTMKLILKSIDDDGSITIKQGEVVLLDEAVDLTTDFLRGSGYFLDNLEVVHDARTPDDSEVSRAKSVYLAEQFDR